MSESTEYNKNKNKKQFNIIPKVITMSKTTVYLMWKFGWNVLQIYKSVYKCLPGPLFWCEVNKL